MKEDGGSGDWDDDGDDPPPPRHGRATGQHDVDIGCDRNNTVPPNAFAHARAVLPVPARYNPPHEVIPHGPGDQVQRNEDLRAYAVRNGIVPQTIKEASDEVHGTSLSFRCMDANSFSTDQTRLYHRYCKKASF